MTQSQVMEHLVKTVGISKKDAIRLAGLGIFRKRKRAARLGRNHIAEPYLPLVR
jgi:nucleoid DNA-binding protein